MKNILLVAMMFIGQQAFSASLVLMEGVDFTPETVHLVKVKHGRVSLVVSDEDENCGGDDICYSESKSKLVPELSVEDGVVYLNGTEVCGEYGFFKGLRLNDNCSLKVKENEVCASFFQENDCVRKGYTYDIILETQE